MIGVGGAVVLAALMGQPHCGSAGYAAGYSYAPSYGYSYYQVPYVQAKLTVVATEPDYGHSYGGLLGQDARYALKAKEDSEFKAELLATLKELAKQKEQPPTIQQFQAPQQVPQYAPAPAYGPSPQSPQATPQQPQFVPQKQVPSKFNPAPLAPQVPAPNPSGYGAGAGEWGQQGPAQDSSQVLTSILGNHCASCHSADAPSGGVALFDEGGNPLNLTIQQLRKIDRAVGSGRMPKNGALPPGEAQALEDAIVGMYQQARR